MFSQIFVLSSRGDVVLFKDYRNELPHTTHELFYSTLIERNGINPIENINGINFVSLENGGLHFVCTVKDVTVSPSLACSFLSNLIRVLKDFCGLIDESSLRRNFVLAYEILDEIIDFGYTQNCSTAKLKSLVKDTSSEVGSNSNILDDVIKQKTKSSSSAARPISISIEDDRAQKNEVYLDLIENLTVTYNPMGELMRSDINGKLVLKSYLKGDPEVQIGLSNDLFIKSRNNNETPQRDAPIIDDINFHPYVNQESFDRDRSMHFFPSDGETTVLNYRISDFTPPFKCYTQLEEISPKMIDFIIKVNPIFPSKYHASPLVVQFNAPHGVESVSFSLAHGADDDDEEEEKQTAVYQRQYQKITWTLPTIYGSSEQILRVKFNWEIPPSSQNILKEIGSLLMDFEIPMYLCSKLQIRYLKIMERSSEYEPDRWIRYLSQAYSYRIRL